VKFDFKKLKKIALSFGAQNLLIYRTV